MKGSYAEVTNVPNTTLSFVVSGTTTYNRQFSADPEAYNLYFHMNKVHDWFKTSPFNYNGMDYRMKGTAYYGGYNGAANGTDVFFGTQDGKLWHSQSDGIYHEYAHNVVYHIYGNWIDPGTQGNTQGDAMDEALPDYFACSLADDPWRPLVERNVSTPDKRYPQDFNTQATSGHRNGLILAGACWDLQKNGGISQNDARKLVFKAMQLTPRPHTFEEFVDNLILQDDSNGNLCDLTPHTTQIIDAFESKHGISPTILPEPLTVSITGPVELGWKQRGTWTANASGGCSSSYTYEWRYRFNGVGNWSQVFATTKSCSFTMADTDFELQAKVTNTGASAYDTHYVEYIVDKIAAPPLAEAAPLPEDFSLSQNYPNPFNPDTEIRYGLPEDSHAQITIFDLLGREVRRLVDEDAPAGYHQVVWDGTDNSRQAVASGVYLYQMSAGSFRDVKKLTLVR